MLRGVITITKEEASEALSCVQIYLPETPLESKLTAALNQKLSNISLQLSDLEVEQLLDNMNAPTEGEAEAKKNLRKSLQSFMTRLKGQE